MILSTIRDSDRYHCAQAWVIENDRYSIQVIVLLLILSPS